MHDRPVPNQSIPYHPDKSVLRCGIQRQCVRWCDIDRRAQLLANMALVARGLPIGWYVPTDAIVPRTPSPTVDANWYEPFTQCPIRTEAGSTSPALALDGSLGAYGIWLYAIQGHTPEHCGMRGRSERWIPRKATSLSIWPCPRSGDTKSTRERRNDGESLNGSLGVHADCPLLQRFMAYDGTLVRRLRQVGVKRTGN